MESYISRSFELCSYVSHFIRDKDYSLGQSEVIVGKYTDGALWVAVNSPSQGKCLTQKFYRRGSFCYRLPEDEFLKSIVLVVYLPITTLLVKIMIPIFLFKPLVFCASVLRGKALKKEMEKKVSIFFKPESNRPLRALVAIIGHIVIGVFALIPLFSNFFNKLNGDLERWVNGCTLEDIKQKSYQSRIKESFYIVPCQQPLFL